MTTEDIQEVKAGVGVAMRFKFRGGDFAILGASTGNLRELFDALMKVEGTTTAPFNVSACRRGMMFTPTDQRWEALWR